MTRPEISIILPCYNEGSTFKKSAEKIIVVLDNPIAAAGPLPAGAGI